MFKEHPRNPNIRVNTNYKNYKYKLTSLVLKTKFDYYKTQTYQNAKDGETCPVN